MGHDFGFDYHDDDHLICTRCGTIVRGLPEETLTHNTLSNFLSIPPGGVIQMIRETPCERAQRGRTYVHEHRGLAG